MNKEFRFKVVEILNKSVDHVQLEVAIGHFVNDQKTLGYDVAAENAWLASKAFMKAMERAYSALKEVPPTKLAGRELAAADPANQDQDQPENANESELEGERPE